MFYYLYICIIITISYVVVGNEHIESDVSKVSKVKTLSTNTVRSCTTSLDCSDNQYCVLGECQQGVELIKSSNWLNSFQLSNFNFNFPSTVLSNTTVKITGDTFGCCNNVNFLYNNSKIPIQNLTSFELSFDLSIESGGWFGDYFGIFIGMENDDIEARKWPSFQSPSSSMGSSYLISFQMYHGDWRGRGIHIYDTYSNKIASSPLPTLLSTFTSVKLKYAQGTTNTWMIYYNDILVLSFDDPNNPRWVESSKSRTSWGFVSQTGGATFSGFIRSVLLTVPPPEIPITRAPSPEPTSFPTYQAGNHTHPSKRPTAISKRPTRGKKPSTDQKRVKKHFVYRTHSPSRKPTQRLERTHSPSKKPTQLQKR